MKLHHGTLLNALKELTHTFCPMRQLLCPLQLTFQTFQPPNSFLIWFKISPELSYPFSRKNFLSFWTDMEYSANTNTSMAFCVSFVSLSCSWKIIIIIKIVRPMLNYLNIDRKVFQGFKLWFPKCGHLKTRWTICSPFNSVNLNAFSVFSGTFKWQFEEFDKVTYTPVFHVLCSWAEAWWNSTGHKSQRKESQKSGFLYEV